MSGMQSKSLIIMSKAQGYDPTRIYDRDTQSYGESIENFDKPPSAFNTGLGRLPQGTPDSFPDATGPVLSEKVTWDTPTPSTQPPGHGSGDPFVGKSFSRSRRLGGGGDGGGGGFGGDGGGGGNPGTDGLGIEPGE